MQPSTLHPTVDEAQAVARGHVYSFLAAALADPAREHFALARNRKMQTVVLAAADLLASEAPENIALVPGEQSPRQLDLLPVVEELSEPREELARGHQEIFGLLVGKAAPPYETEYCRSALTFYRTQELADIAGFYRAFGLEQDRAEPERQDHISVELEFMAHLIERELAAAVAEEPALQEKAPLCRDAQKKFFEAHLAWWVPAFAELLRRASPRGFYSALADVFARFIPCERAILGIAPARDLVAPQQPEKPAVEKFCCGAMPCE
ncbi:MAG: molecular chaperone TorD family protein [Acidobacteria bacterium]|nr:molecular chaperone TorD family protein [Acidobacteriota bacterium]